MFEDVQTIFVGLYFASWLAVAVGMLVLTGFLDYLIQGLIIKPFKKVFSLFTKGK